MYCSFLCKTAGTNSNSRKKPPSPEDLGSQPTGVAQELEFLQTFMGLEEAERKLLGHSFSSFIKGCTFRGRDCLEES